jgi:chromosome segregation ATPase
MEMANDIEVLPDNGVKIDGEIFTLTAVPDPKSNLVAQQKKSILVDLTLDSLIEGLKRSAGLLFLAFNGVAGNGELRRDTNELQDKLAQRCADTQLALNRFSNWSSSVLESIRDVFTYLVDGQEDIAITLLQENSAVAAKMAAEAEALAQKFDKLADDTMTVSGKTQIAQAQSDEEKRKFEAQRTDLLAKTANAKSLSTSLAASRKKLEGLYNEAKSKADTAAERGFAVQMVGAILGPIAQGLGSIGGAFVAAKTGGLAAPSTPPAAPKADSTEETAAKNKLKEEEAKKATAEEELAAAKASVVKADSDKTSAIEAASKQETAATLAVEKAVAAPDDAALKAAAEKAKAAAETAKTAKETADKLLAEAKLKQEQKQKALDAIGSAIKSAQEAVETAAKNLQSVGAGLLDLAKSYEEEKRKYLDLMLKYESQEAEALANMAEYAVRMTAVTDAIGVQKTSSESLFQAIKAFNTVAQILRDAAKFWTQMKDACDDLATPKIQSRIEMFSKLPAERRAAEWKKEVFRTMAVTYMAKWQALHLICLEYSEAATSTRTEIKANIVLSPNYEESYKLVPDLAKKMSLDAQRASNAAVERTTAIEEIIKADKKAA